MAACDIDCQRKKQLKALSSALVTATQNKARDPKAYDTARTAYYTAKEGQSWAQADKEQKANSSLQPILDLYQSKFDKMKQDITNQAAAAQAKQDVMNSQIGDEDEIRFVHSQVEQERDKASIYQRLNELADISVSVYSWLPSFLDLLLGISILFLVYQIFVQGKLTNLQNYFTQTTPG